MTATVSRQGHDASIGRLVDPQLARLRDLDSATSVSVVAVELQSARQVFARGQGLRWFAGQGRADDRDRQTTRNEWGDTGTGVIVHNLIHELDTC